MLYGVGLAMSEIVGRVDAPLRAGARVRRVQDAIQDGVPQVHVAGSKVDLRPQHAGTIRKLAGAHIAKQVEICFHRTVAIGRSTARFGQRAAHRPHLVGGRVVDIGEAGTNEVLGPVVQRLEVVRRMVQMLAPVEAQPAHVPLDGVDVFLLLLHGIGIVEAKVAAAAVLDGKSEIQADRLCVAEMQIAVRFRRKARDDALDQAAGEVSLDHVANEIPGLCGRGGLRHRLLVVHLPVNLHTGVHTGNRRPSQL